MSISQEQLSRIRSGMSSIRAPGPHDKVHNDECVYSFDSPFSEQGIFVNLSTWQGVGVEYLDLDREKHGSHLYLQEIFQQVLKPQADPVEEGAPTKLAIGVDGGFLPGENKYETVKQYYLCYIDDNGVVDRIDLPNANLPEFVSNVCEAIINHQGFRTQVQVQEWEDSDERPVSKYADSLPLVDNGKKISNNPATWACEDSGLKENLWLNLSTGYIGSGRQNWDGTGGTGAALRHYQETGNLYPLVVKLGTITSHGADVWSYSPEEDCLVTDPKLAEHLSHWGIDIMKLEKTDKSMAEMNVDLNLNYEWGKITEEGKTLEKRQGPGYVGLTNTGNSCYMNSLLETLYNLPEFQQRYFHAAPQIFRTAPNDIAADFSAQMAKLGNGIFSDRYVAPPSIDGEDYALLERYKVIPRMLKHVVGKGHPEFSSNHQQDALEYYQHFLEHMSRVERTQMQRLGGESQLPTASLFSFEMEARLECTESHTVKYVPRPDNVLSLSIPLDRAVNADELVEHDLKRMKTEGEQARPPAMVSVDECLSATLSTEIIQMFSPAVGHQTNTTSTVRFKNFPRYLMVQLRRYYVDENWQPKKIDALVPMPEHLNLEEYRSTGLQSSETPMPEGAPQSAGGANAPLTADDNVVGQLMGMGFSQNACIRAALAANNDPDAATNWILSHMDDADLNDPIPAASAGAGADTSSADVDPEVLMMLTSMGFTESQVKGALKATGGSADRAAEWLFSHADDLDAAVAALQSDAPAGAAVASGGPSQHLEDGEGRYTLVAFISHMGRNTGHGHYVCHIKKGDEWVLFNDDKVAHSEETPLSYGYMYLYRRDDAPSHI